MSEFNDDTVGQEDNAHTVRINAFRDAHKGKSLRELVQAQRDAQARKEALEADLKNANAEFDVLRFELVPAKMDEDGVDKITFDGIGRVSLTADIRLSLPKANQQPMFAWLRKRRMGDLITEVVNPSTLKAWVKNRMKEGKEYPSDLLQVTPITRASITKG